MISFKKLLVTLCVALYCTSSTFGDSSLDEHEENSYYTIEGKVYPPELFTEDSNWYNTIESTIFIK